MDGPENDTIENMDDEQLARAVNDLEEEKEDSLDEQAQLSNEMKELYGGAEPEEKMNAHTFLHQAAFKAKDTTRITYLKEEELGRPLFSIRFMLDMEDIAKYYLDPLLVSLKEEQEALKEKGKPYVDIDVEKNNGIANYFYNKIQNVTDSGMSNMGFSMNLNVTRKMDATRRKSQASMDNLKGGNRN